MSGLDLTPDILLNKVISLMDYILESVGAHYNMGWLAPARLLNSSLKLLLTDSTRMLNMGNINIRHWLTL